MWGTEYVAVPPQRNQGNVSICNRYWVIGPPDVTDRDISLVSLGWDCNVFRPPHPLFPPLTDMLDFRSLH